PSRQIPVVVAGLLVLLTGSEIMSYQQREKTGNGYLSGPEYETGHRSQMSATARCQDNSADDEDASEHIFII
ncbi:hypothetical protein ODY36_004855, partial [Salmonella enterica]|nr:hypothetical protein [Salmonella enterica]